MIKLNYDGTFLNGMQNVIGNASGFEAFPGGTNPISGGVYFTASEIDF